MGLPLLEEWIARQIEHDLEDRKAWVPDQRRQ
jgi:hypothetical protein